MFTDIDKIRQFFLRELPPRIVHFFRGLEDTIWSISPYFYILAIVLFAAAAAVFLSRFMTVRKREAKRAQLMDALSGAGSVQETIGIVSRFLKEIKPGIRAVGIYRKEGNIFKLVNASQEPGETARGEFGSEPLITTLREYESSGPYHIYTVTPKDRSSAIRVASRSRLVIRDIAPELGCLSILLENFIEKEHIRTELVRTSILMRSKEVFSSPLFDREMYFKFVGQVIIKATGLDAVQIGLGERSISLGSIPYDPAQGKMLRVRNTDIVIGVSRRSGITTEDLLLIGRFLDLVSGMISVFADKSHISSCLHFLESAVKSFEGSDLFYRNHSNQVERLAVALGRTLRLDDGRLENLRFAAKLHDIGMIGEIFDLATKDLRFSERDYNAVKYHPIIGSAVVAPIDPTGQISNIILQHHELRDGTGYPFGLAGEQILSESGILSFCEIFVGLVSDRPHRKAHPFPQAIEQVSALVPAKVDAEVFNAFMQERDKIRPGFHLD